MPTDTAQHTPGPWVKISRPIGPDTEVAHWRIFDQFDHPIADSPVGPYAFDQANGRLIAAAPALLAALEEIQLRVNEFCSKDCKCTMGRINQACSAAIAAARGDA